METTIDPQARQDGRRPHPFIWLDLLGASLLLLLVLALAGSAWGAFREVVYLAGVSGWLGDGAVQAAESRSGGDVYLRAAHLLALICFVLFVLAGFLPVLQVAISRLFGGMAELVRPPLAHDKRPSLGEAGDVIGVVKSGEIEHYREISPFMNSLFGRRSVYLRPVERGVVSALGGDLRGWIYKFVFGGLAIMGLLWLLRWLESPSAGEILSEGMSAELVETLRQSATMRSALLPFVWLLALSIGFAMAAYLVIQVLLPSEVAEVRTAYGGDDVRGFGHPQQLHVRLPRIVEGKQLDPRRPNTSWSPPLLETRSASINDAGTFGSVLLVERFPEPLLGGKEKGLAVLMQILGWAAALGGVWIMLGHLLPGAVNRVADPGSAPPLLWLPLYVLGASLASHSLFAFARNWLEHSRSLALAVRYRSVVLYAEFNGQMTVSEVRVGKAAHDSLESSRRVVSSDFTARYYAAEMISESDGQGGVRSIVELRDAPLAREWLQHIHEQVRAIGCEPVRISGIDANAEAEGMIQTNIRISQNRNRIDRVGSGSPPALGMAETPLIGERGEADGADPTGEGPRPGYRECPQCAEWIRQKARICRYCGSNLEGATPA